MVNIRRILAPTDFTEHTRPALRYAVELAEKFGAELILLHVIPDAVLAMPDAVMPAPVPMADLNALTQSGRDGLAHLIAAEKIGHLRPRAEVRIGSPATEILAAATDLRADLLCIVTHGRSGLARLFMGSVAEAILREAPCPVLTVRSVT